MFSIKRNQVVVTALAVMIAVAGYLNFTESKSSVEANVDLQGPTNYQALLNDDGSISTLQDDDNVNQFAMGDDLLGTEGNTKSVYDDTGAAIYVNSSQNATAYFVQAKLEREQSRASQKDLLTEMLNSSNIANEKKQECADNLLKIQERIEKETAAEAMIESKGFNEVYVRIDDDTVDVVVSKSELSETELAQIMDIVTRKTGMKENQVRISPLKTAVQ